MRPSRSAASSLRGSLAAAIVLVFAAFGTPAWAACFNEGCGEGPPTGGTQEYILSGGPNSSSAICADDQVNVCRNGERLYCDWDVYAGCHNGPIRFLGTPGDTIRVAALDYFGSCRSMGPIWIHAASGDCRQLLFAGRDDGCAGYPRQTTFFDQTFVIPDLEETCGSLIVAIKAKPSKVEVGDPVLVTLVATNLGQSTITDVLPLDSPTASGTGQAVLVEGPSPAGAGVILPGKTLEFKYKFEATGEGRVNFSGMAYGRINGDAGRPISSEFAYSNEVKIGPIEITVRQISFDGDVPVRGQDNALVQKPQYDVDVPRFDPVAFYFGAGPIAHVTFAARHLSEARTYAIHGVVGLTSGAFPLMPVQRVTFGPDRPEVTIDYLLTGPPEPAIEKISAIRWVARDVDTGQRKAFTTRFPIYVILGKPLHAAKQPRVELLDIGTEIAAAKSDRDLIRKEMTPGIYRWLTGRGYRYDAGCGFLVSGGFWDLTLNLTGLLRPTTSPSGDCQVASALYQVVLNALGINMRLCDTSLQWGGQFTTAPAKAYGLDTFDRFTFDKHVFAAFGGRAWDPTLRFESGAAFAKGLPIDDYLEKLAPGTSLASCTLLFGVETIE